MCVVIQGMSLPAVCLQNENPTSRSDDRHCTGSRDNRV